MKKIFFAISLWFSLSAFAENTPSQENNEFDKVEIPRGRYITGGVLASTVGLGIGSAVQGRYADKGWIFTSTEVAGFLLVSHANCFRGRDYNSPDRAVRERSDCENVMEGITGVGLFLGFHVWEILDAWINAKPTSNNTSLFIIPSAQGPALSFSSSF